MKFEVVKGGRGDLHPRQPATDAAARRIHGSGLATSKSGRPVASLSDGRPAWLRPHERLRAETGMADWLTRPRRTLLDRLFGRFRAEPIEE